MRKWLLKLYYACFWGRNIDTWYGNSAFWAELLVNKLYKKTCSLETLSVRYDLKELTRVNICTWKTWLHCKEIISWSRSKFLRAIVTGANIDTPKVVNCRSFSSKEHPRLYIDSKLMEFQYKLWWFVLKKNLIKCTNSNGRSRNFLMWCQCHSLIWSPSYCVFPHLHQFVIQIASPKKIFKFYENSKLLNCYE